MGLYWHFVDLVWVFIFALLLSLVRTDAWHRHVAHAEGQQHPIKLYLVVWGWLFILSTCSYLVDYFHLQGYLQMVADPPLHDR